MQVQKRTAAERVALARHPKRPSPASFIHALFTDFFEQKGDRLYGDDEAIIGGIALFHGRPVTVLGHQKGKDLEQNLRCHFGMPMPDGYRKAQRLMRQAEKFQRPIITFIDTPGAYPGIEAEARGQGEAIACCLSLMSGLTVPILAVITGEGGSGGALALAMGNRVLMLENAEKSNVRRASAFYKLIRYSYASGLTSYGSQPHDMWSNFPLIEQAHRRLAKVVIENKDFEKLIGQYDRPVSFFYCDPPYFETESYYKNVGEDGFTEKDHIRLRDVLLRIDGKFLLSYNDCEFIRSLYEAPGIQTEAFTRINNIKQRYDNGAQFPEILIANYDLHEREKNAPSQLNLFGEGGFME